MSIKTKAKVVFFFTLIPYFLIYFIIQSVVTTGDYNFLTYFDEIIPFNPHFVWIYHTIIPMIAITLIILIKSKDLFLSTIVAFLLATAVLFLFYIFFPSFYPRENFIDNSSISGFLVEITRKIDGAQNTFPSSHVTFSWLITFFVGLSTCVKKNKWIYRGYFVWALLISLSTLAIKQHFIVDVFSGIILAFLCYLVSKKIVFVRLSKAN